MKIKGKQVTNDNLEIVVIPRKDGPLIFKFRPVIDFAEFDNYVKEPVPPTITKAGGDSFLDYEDATYKIRRMEYFVLKQNWMFYQSMLATDDLEFDTIKANDPSTYNNIDSELESAQFAVVEKNLLYQAFQSANSLNETKLNEARESFLATTQVV